MRLLVTGAGGFLGRHVVAEAARRGHHVHALVRPVTHTEELGWPTGVRVFRADLRGRDDLSAAFEGVDVLVHLAAAVGGVVGSDELQFASTVVGTEHLLDAMAASRTRRLVLASSFSVYDWSRIRGSVTEESPLEADLYERDGYAIAKVWQERVVRRAAASRGWDLCVLRPGWIWGRDHAYLSGIGQSLGRVHVLFGAARPLALTHVDNCAHCFVTCAEDPRAFGRTFNVVDDHRVSNWRYLGTYLQGTGMRQVRAPLPYGLCMLGVRVAHMGSRAMFRGKGKLPSILVPCRFEARFNPVKASGRSLREVIGWRAPLSFAECVARTYQSGAGATVHRAGEGPETPLAASANSPIGPEQCASHT